MAIPTPQDIERVIAAVNRATEAAIYGETIVCEMQQVSGDNYKMVWSTQYDGPFVPGA